MKVKELKALLNSFNDEKEIDFYYNYIDWEHESPESVKVLFESLSIVKDKVIFNLEDIRI